MFVLGGDGGNDNNAPVPTGGGNKRQRNGALSYVCMVLGSLLGRD